MTVRPVALNAAIACLFIIGSSLFALRAAYPALRARVARRQQEVQVRQSRRRSPTTARSIWCVLALTTALRSEPMLSDMRCPPSTRAANSTPSVGA